ncbi:TPA: hypothetical protein ACFM7A_000020 [Neisseria meningitidis]|uniref:hypothetical protein n=2 Tax=Neisseria meningitidis TaxID=487 RepID=UPI001956C851|nr:hypothetical protein [Neisseria meningitidis]MCV6758965.1 hypothetical protein [Neisseria meningitidis]
MMTRQDDGAFAVPFGQMDEAEIIAHFKRYGFTDELGHALELCADFLDLVRFAKRDGACSIVKNGAEV